MNLPLAFDLKEQMKKGHNFKDWLCPDSMEFQKDHFRLNDRWGRVLYLQGYASYIKDSMIAELCDMDRSLMLSIDILPVPTDEAVREIQNKLLGVETNAANWQRKQNAANNFSAVLPYDMEQQRKETKEMKQGEVIGYVGTTGNSTGNHLHFEVWQNGERTDALGYFKAKE